MITPWKKKYGLFYFYYMAYVNILAKYYVIQSEIIGCTVMTQRVKIIFKEYNDCEVYMFLLAAKKQYIQYMLFLFKSVCRGLLSCYNESRREAVYGCRCLVGRSFIRMLLQ